MLSSIRKVTQFFIGFAIVSSFLVSFGGVSAQASSIGKITGMSNAQRPFIYSEGFGRTSVAPAAQFFNSKLYATHCGDDRRIYCRVYPNSNWNRFEESTYTDDFITGTTSGTRTNMISTIHRGTDSRIYFTMEYLTD